jgi:hypothetical protein
MDKTQIVTHLVAALLTNSERLRDIRFSYDAQSQSRLSDHEVAVDYACMVADYIIDRTIEPIEFPQ